MQVPGSSGLRAGSLRFARAGSRLVPGGFGAVSGLVLVEGSGDGL